MTGGGGRRQFLDGVGNGKPIGSHRLKLEGKTDRRIGKGRDRREGNRQALMNIVEAEGDRDLLLGDLKTKVLVLKHN